MQLPDKRLPEVVTIREGEKIVKYRCTVCGATAQPNERKRFLKRHPKPCAERRAFMKQLASGTRSVPDLDDVAGEPYSG